MPNELYNDQGLLRKNFAQGSSIQTSSPDIFSAGNTMFKDILSKQLYNKEDALQYLGGQTLDQKKDITSQLETKLVARKHGSVTPPTLEGLTMGPQQRTQYTKTIQKQAETQTAQAEAFKALDKIRTENEANNPLGIPELSKKLLKQVSKYGKQLLNLEQKRLKISQVVQQKNYDTVWKDYDTRVSALNTFFV